MAEAKKTDIKDEKDVKNPAKENEEKGSEKKEEVSPYHKKMTELIKRSGGITGGVQNKIKRFRIRREELKINMEDSGVENKLGDARDKLILDCVEELITKAEKAAKKGK